MAAAEGENSGSLRVSVYFALWYALNVGYNICKLRACWRGLAWPSSLPSLCYVYACVHVSSCVRRRCMIHIGCLAAVPPPCCATDNKKVLNAVRLPWTAATLQLYTVFPYLLVAWALGLRPSPARMMVITNDNDDPPEETLKKRKHIQSGEIPFDPTPFKKPL